MDDYLDCLFEHVLEPRLDERARASAEYQRAADDALRKSDILESMLAPEQKAALDALLAADSRILTMDERIIFQEAVALGKWMAR